MRAPHANAPPGQNLRAKLRPARSLRSLLVVPVVLQMVATAGLISLLSDQNLRSTTDRMAATIQERTGRQVSDDLHAYLEVPQHARCQVRGGPASVLDIGQKTIYCI